MHMRVIRVNKIDIPVKRLRMRRQQKSDQSFFRLESYKKESGSGAQTPHFKSFPLSGTSLKNDRSGKRGVASCCVARTL